MIKNLLLASIIFFVLLVNGCKELGGGDETIVNAVPEQFFTLKPVGTISGKVVNRHNEKPVNGAVVTIAFNGVVINTTTDISGSFSFADVPCNTDATTGTVTGTYQLTVSLVEINKTIPDSLPKYREYYFNNTLNVTFIDLANCDSCRNKVPVEGLEAYIRFDVAKLNTTVSGSVVDDKYNPVAGATVWLREAGTGDVLQRTTTDEAGNYSFLKVEDGISVFVQAKSADEELQGTNPVFTLTINRTIENLRQQVTAERVVLTPADDVAPYITSISPENLQDVNPTDVTVVYRFSEPIKQTAYTDTNAQQGLGTLIDDIQFNSGGLKKAAGGNTNFRLSWDATNTVLTIIPAGIIGSAKYQVNITAALGKLTDRAGNSAAPNPYGIVGDNETLNFTTNGGTAVPGKPAVVRRLSAGTNYDQLDFDGGLVGLEWNLDPNARSYRIFRSINGDPFTLLADNVRELRYDDNTGPLVSGYNPPGDRDPFVAFTINYKVVGISKDLAPGPESDPIVVQDGVAPQLISVNADSSLIGFDYVFLRFSEPLSIANAQTKENYSITNITGSTPSQITEAVYRGWTGTFYEVRLQITKHSISAGEIINVSPNVADLNGNAMDQNTRSSSF